MARLAQLFLLLLSARALADDGCVADGTCQADEAEASALLQSAASQKARATQHSDVNTTKTTTLTCYPNYAAATCGASMKCFQDTTGCTTSGGGVCCKAAGNGAGLEQCKFCGDSTCGPCPTGPAPTPTPAPTPAPTPSPSQQCDMSGCSGCSGEQCQICLDEKEKDCCLDQACRGCSGEQCTYCREDHTTGCCAGKHPATPGCGSTPAPTASCQGAYQTCGTWGSTGQWYGYCCSGLVCIAPSGNAIGAPNTCQYPVWGR